MGPICDHARVLCSPCLSRNLSRPRGQARRYFVRARDGSALDLSSGWSTPHEERVWHATIGEVDDERFSLLRRCWGSGRTFQRSIICAHPLPDVVARLREAIEAADLWVLHEIDPQALLERGGYAIRPARQILFFHPPLMARLLAADPAALIEAPLKFAVLDLPDGAVSVRWNDPAAAFARYGNAALTTLGQEFASVCEQIAAVSLGSRAAPDS